MAHLVETLFTTREKAWHGLGTVVQEAPTSRDAIELAELNWRVDSRPIYDAFGKEIKGFKANTRDSDNSILGIVTDKYRIVQNTEAFEFTDNLLNNNEDIEIHYESAGSLKNGKTIWLLAQMPTTTILGDDVEPYICFTNSHDGTGAIRIAMTPIRVVCNNTLNLALQTAKRSWSTKHMGDMNSKLAEARETLGFATAYMENLNLTAEQMAEKKITDGQIEQILNELFPVDKEKDSERKIKNVEEIKNSFMTCYYMPDIKQFRNTAWGLVNAMSDMAAHVKPTRESSNYRENNWNRTLNGHPLVDAMVKAVARV